jgi:hypothetical protein
LGRFLLIALAILVSQSACTKDEPVRACCSCTCVAADGGFCAGAKREALGDETCEDRCAKACEDNGCRLDEATIINEGACEGGLMPFLGGKE